VIGRLADGRTQVFLSATSPVTPKPKEAGTMPEPRTKAQEVFEKVEALVAEGVEQAEAFRRLAKEYDQPVNSLRGLYYRGRPGEQGGNGGNGGSSRRRSRRRETTPQDALSDALAVLEDAKDAIDAEVEAARERAEEAQAEYDAMAEAAPGRKAEIQARIDLLSPPTQASTAKPSTDKK
jgi:hypothetical protein